MNTNNTTSTTGFVEEEEGDRLSSSFNVSSSIISATATTSIARGEAPATAKRFVMISKQHDNPFFQFSKSGCEFQALELTQTTTNAILCEYTGPQEANNAQEQVAIVEEILRTRPDVTGIAISVINAKILSPVLALARSQGIHVVTFDSDALAEGRSTYVRTDNYAMGQALAKILHMLNPQGGIYGLLTSSNSTDNLAQRLDGFRDKMSLYPQWSESATSPLYASNECTSEALDCMDDFAALQYPHNLQAIVPLGGWPMWDGNQTRFRRFVHQNRHLTLVAADALPVQVDLWMNGYVDGLVGQVPREMGVQAVNALHELSSGREVNSTITLTHLMEMVRSPALLPPLEVDENHIDNLRWIGVALYTIILATALTCLIWTFTKRKVRVVRASQPIFLGMVAIGAGIMGSALVPLSFDDTQLDSMHSTKGNVMCMAVPWLSCVGFAVAFSALFTKTLRINRIFHGRMAAYERVTVRVRDVMGPFGVLVGANVVILLAWTLLNPLQYVRKPHEGTDLYNRVISYYGTCRSQRGSSAPYLAMLFVVNLSLLIVANIQAYQARSIQSEFAESKYIATAMVSFLQAGFTGIPILFVVREIPQAFYLILVFMIFIVSMATLLLIFVPKILFERQYQSKTPDQRRQQFQRSVQQSSQRHLNISSQQRSQVGGGPGGSEYFTFEADELAQFQAAAAAKANENPLWQSDNSQISDVAEEDGATAIIINGMRVTNQPSSAARGESAKMSSMSRSSGLQQQDDDCNLKKTEPLFNSLKEEGEAQDSGSTAMLTEERDTEDFAKVRLQPRGDKPPLEDFSESGFGGMRITRKKRPRIVGLGDGSESLRRFSFGSLRSIQTA